MRQTTILKTLTMTVMMMTATPTWAQDALLDGYVQQMIDASLPAAKRSVTANTRSASAYLTGNDARVYNLLVPIIRDIAAGKILHTRISVSPEDIYGGKCEFTAADLGVAGYPDLLFLACDPTGTAEQYTIHEIPMMYIYDSGTQSTFPEEDRILSTTPYATTGIREVRSEGVKGDNWYDLNGRRLNGQPTKKGLYIRNGKKTIIR